MSKISPINYEDNNNENQDGFLNFDYLTQGKGEGLPISDSPDYEPAKKEKKKRTTTKKKKETSSDDNNTEAVVVNQVSPKDLAMHQTNVPYSTLYEDTNNMLKGTIQEIDSYSIYVREEMEHVKGSKTIKNKYNIFSDLTNAGSALLNTKLGAIKEMNKIITDSNNLELKRMKEINNAPDMNDDTQYIQQLYSVMMQGNNMIPQDVYNINQADLQSMMITDNSNVYGYGQDQMNQPLTPEQQRMRMDVLDPDIKLCVIYNATTGEKWFEGRNLRTGETIADYPIPDASFIPDTQVYPNEGIARNVNIDATYPLITVTDKSVNIY